MAYLAILYARHRFLRWGEVERLANVARDGTSDVVVSTTLQS